MPYVRCDVNCNPKTPQPGHYDVSQEESCLVYENYNKDYIRTDSECNKDCAPIPFVCFNEPPAVGTSVTDLININFITPATYGDEIYIASEDGADYFIELTSERYRLLPEDNTPIDPQYLLSN
jgi:hypothetical protein